MTDTPSLSLNYSLIKKIRSFYPSASFTARHFCERVTEGQTFYFAHSEKQQKFNCEVDSFKVRKITPYFGPKTENRDSLILILEYCTEGKKGKEKECLVDDFFIQELNTIFLQGPDQRPFRALVEAQEYQNQLERTWSKLWLPND